MIRFGSFRWLLQAPDRPSAFWLECQDLQRVKWVSLHARHDQFGSDTGLSCKPSSLPKPLRDEGSSEGDRHEKRRIRMSSEQLKLYLKHQAGWRQTYQFSDLQKISDHQRNADQPFSITPWGCFYVGGWEDWMHLFNDMERLVFWELQRCPCMNSQLPQKKKKNLPAASVPACVWRVHMSLK